MADFVNTIDLLGEDVAVGKIISGDLTEFFDDTIKSLKKYAFRERSNLIRVRLSNVASLGSSPFYKSGKLEYADFTKLGTVIMEMFNMCTALKTVVLRKEELCTLSDTGAFTNTPFASGKAGGTLLVPRSLLESYKTATNWSVIWGYGHNRFLALEDYTVDGTITGEIDWDKLGGTT